jgi:D-inositol-3-phosphate glycosyltransferase
MERISSRLRAIVRKVPGARRLRWRVLTLMAARSAALDTEPPRGAFDRPDGLTVPREAVAFDGWAIVGKRTVAEVEIVLNDRTTVRATLGRARPDVRENLHEPGVAVSCGWIATVDLTHWPLGELRVKVIARSRSRRSSVIGNRVYTVTGSGFEGHIDEPRDGTQIDNDLLVVKGWATVGHRPVSRLDISVDGRRVGLARLRVIRRDVELHSGGRLGPVTGFEYRGVVPPGPSMDLAIGLTAHTLDGTTVAVPPRHIRMTPRDEHIDEAYVASLQARTRTALSAIPKPSAGTGGPAGTRLLVFTHSLTLGGGQLYLTDLLRELAPTLDHCVVVSAVDGVLRSDLETQGIQVIILENPSRTTLELYEDHVRERAIFIRRSGCNVVMLNTLGPWSSGDACLRAGVSFVWAIHESFELSDWLGLNFGAIGLPTSVRRRMESALGAAHSLIFEARATSEMFAQYTDSARRIVLPYRVDIASIAEFSRGFDRGAARREHNLAEDATVVLVMGMLEERKSQACIVEAFAGVAGVHPEAQLILVGDYPCEYSDAVHQLVSESGMAARITLIPITPDIVEWYALSDLLLSASDVESLPRSMLECMALGVPVLSTSVFGVPELIEDGVNGWLFGARDMSELSAALHRVLSLTPDQRRAVGAAASVAVHQRHSAHDYIGAYRRLLAAALATP